MSSWLWWLDICLSVVCSGMLASAGTPLHYACNYNWGPCAAALIDGGASLIKRSAELQLVALHLGECGPVVSVYVKAVLVEVVVVNIFVCVGANKCVSVVRRSPSALETASSQTKYKAYVCGTC